MGPYTADDIADAQQVAAGFSPRRLRLARESTGLTQNELAARLAQMNGGQHRVSATAISQAERGAEGDSMNADDHTTPRPENLLAFAEALGFGVKFFAGGIRDRGAPARVYFRHLSRTKAAERRRADGFVELIEMVVEVIEQHVELPTWQPITLAGCIEPSLSPRDNPRIAEDIECAADQARSQLGLADGPIGDLLTSVERNGLIVVRDLELGDRHGKGDDRPDRDIDAYSDNQGVRPIIVLTGHRSVPWVRDRFNIAHELGHVVLHRHVGRGPKIIEDQAHRFGNALLAPRSVMIDVLPDNSTDPRDYYDLKLEWGVSIAALMHRAYDLGRLDADRYALAMKYRSANGWRIREPGDDLRDLSFPRLLSTALHMADLTTTDVSSRTGIPPETIGLIVGPGPKPTVSLG